MHKSRLLLPSSIFGFIGLAIIFSFAKWDFSNIWVPISAIYLFVGFIVYVIRETFKSIETKFISIEERLKTLEEQTKK